MPQENLTISFFQQDIRWEDPEANYRLVEQHFDSLAQKPDILVVPETFTTGFGDTMASLAEEPQGPSYQFACQMAKKHDALFVGTWCVRDNDIHGTPVVYNRLHWVKPDGTFGYYDKAHTFRMSSEAAQLARGTQRKVFSWRGWNIKPAICYDLRFPQWLRNGNTLDYDLLLVCANWPASRHEAWTTLLKARAIENLCYVVGTNRVGTDGIGIPYSGHSAAYNQKGQEIASCTPEQCQAQVATLSYTKLSTFRQHWPFHLDFD